MTDRFDRALDLVFAHEGGFCNHDADPGGATKYGVTHRTLARWRGVASCGPSEVRRLREDEARAIYRAQYWVSVRGDDLPDGVAYCAFDFAVNSGPRRAIKHLQRAAGLRGRAVDGVIGGMTMAAIRRVDPRTIINRMCDTRLSFMRALSTWKTFGRGWSRRVKDVRSKALSFAAGGAACPACGQPITPNPPPATMAA